MTRMKKAEAIFLCLSEPEVDLWRLREFALTEGGLVDDSLRRLAWPKLLGIDRSDESIFQKGMEGGEKFVPDGSGIPSEMEMDQVERDVARCTWHLLTTEQRRQWRGKDTNSGGGQCRSTTADDDECGLDGTVGGMVMTSSNSSSKRVAALLRRKQKKLGNLINMVLRASEGDIKYYQGYHDVASIVLSTMGSDGLVLTKAVLEKFTYSHLRDATKTNFADLTTMLRLVILPLIAKFDSRVHSHLRESGVEPFFALSWVLTWFSHDVRDTSIAARLFDAFLAAHPLLPVYVAVAMVVHPVNRQIILSTDADFAEMHGVLTALPRNTCSAGWRSDGGYGSEDDFDDENNSHGTDTTSSDSALLHRHQAHVNSQSVGQGGPANRCVPVPTQELIRAAISYMRQVPPRKLLALARRYDRRDPQRQQLLEGVSQISALRPPPSWALAPSVPSDWVLKQRARGSAGGVSELSPRRKDRRTMGQRRKKYAASTDSATTAAVDGSVGYGGDGSHKEVEFDPSDLSKNHRDARAASGAAVGGGGPAGWEGGVDDTAMKILLWGGFAVAIMSVTWALLSRKVSPSGVGGSSGAEGAMGEALWLRPDFDFVPGGHDVCFEGDKSSGTVSLVGAPADEESDNNVFHASFRFLRNVLSTERETFWP